MIVSNNLINRRREERCFEFPAKALQGLDVLHWVGQTVPGPGRCHRECPITEDRTPCGWDNQRQVVGGPQAATVAHFGGPVKALGKVCWSWAAETATGAHFGGPVEALGKICRSWAVETATGAHFGGTMEALGKVCWSGTVETATGTHFGGMEVARQGVPELSRGDSGGQGRTIRTGFAQWLAASGAREAEELCALISWLRRPTEQRHSERTIAYPLGDQWCRRVQKCSNRPCWPLGYESGSARRVEEEIN